VIRRFINNNRATRMRRTSTVCCGCYTPCELELLSLSKKGAIVNHRCLRPDNLLLVANQMEHSVLLVDPMSKQVPATVGVDINGRQVRFYAGPGNTTRRGHRYCNQRGRPIDFSPEDCVLFHSHKRWPFAPCQLRIRQALRRRSGQWSSCNADYSEIQG
jgi:hypothetical protein